MVPAMDKKNFSRRAFIRRGGSLGAVVVALTVVGCGGEEETGGGGGGGTGGGGGGGGGLSCDGVDGLTEAELGMRTSQAYVSSSPHGTEKNCLNCMLGAGLTATSCGTCSVIKGEIHPEGYCNLWVARPA